MQKPLLIYSNYLWFLTLTYSMVIVLANWFDPRFVTLWGMTTDAGTLIFPLSQLMLSMWFFKVMVELIGLPISIVLTRKLKYIERLDIYDFKTDLNPFRLEVNYAVLNNGYEINQDIELGYSNIYNKQH